MEVVDRHGGDRGVGAHLGERSQSGQAVERGVLDALRHHRSGYLREALRDLESGVGQQWLELGEGRREVGAASTGLGERDAQMLAPSGRYER